MNAGTGVPFVDLLSEHEASAPEIEAAIAGLLRRGDWILGDEVALFEREFAAYCGVRHAVGTDSGMSALALIFRALGIGRGDEVIAPSNTFIATIFAIMHVGATPVLVDCEPDTYQIDPSRVGAALTPRTRAIVPVHLYGQSADMDPILELAEDAGVAVVEDACQAHGARLRGRRVGSLGTAAAFSFYPSKNLGAYGDGGMIVTNDATLANSVRILRNYGQRRKYHHVVPGFNHRLDTLQAAILRVKLRALDHRNAARRHLAAVYAQELRDVPVVVPATRPDAEHVWHLYVIRTTRRRDLQTFLAQNQIATGIHYPLPVHLQAACAQLGYGKGSFPLSERFAKEVLSLPMYPQLDAAVLESIADRVRRFHARSRRPRAHTRVPSPAVGPVYAPQPAV